MREKFAEPQPDSTVAGAGDHFLACAAIPASEVAVGADGRAGKPSLLAQSPLLEGADEPAFDPSGNL